MVGLRECCSESKAWKPSRSGQTETAGRNSRQKQGGRAGTYRVSWLSSCMRIRIDLSLYRVRMASERPTMDVQLFRYSGFKWFRIFGLDQTSCPGPGLKNR